MQFDVQVSFLLVVKSLGNGTDDALDVDAEADFDVDAPTLTPEFDVDAEDWP